MEFSGHAIPLVLLLFADGRRTCPTLDPTQEHQDTHPTDYNSPPGLKRGRQQPPKMHQSQPPQTHQSHRPSPPLLAGFDMISQVGGRDLTIHKRPSSATPTGAATASDSRPSQETTGSHSVPALLRLNRKSLLAVGRPHGELARGGDDRSLGWTWLPLTKSWLRPGIGPWGLLACVAEHRPMCRAGVDGACLSWLAGVLGWGWMGGWGLFLWWPRSCLCFLQLRHVAWKYG